MGNDSYVYGHFDKDSNCFYIGKGVGNRAHAKSTRQRHPVWYYYVNKYLSGHFEVKILKDNLTSEEAEFFEEAALRKFGYNLVNWFNPCRTCDLEMNRKYHTLVGINKKLIADSKAMEKIDIDKAIEGYRKAIDKIPEYNNLPLEWIGDSPALVDRINLEMDTVPKKGEIVAIERLTFCLCKKGLREEAKNEAIKYFENHPYDFSYKGYVDVMKRVYKGEDIPPEVLKTFKKRDDYLENHFYYDTCLDADKKTDIKGGL